MTTPAASTPEHHRNNLDAVRVGAAMLVLVSHSFALTGRTEYRFLSWTPLGQLGVYIFFAISGYLVIESWRRDPDVARFLARRALRIFPGLAVCIALSAFALGPLVTRLPASEYFSHPATWAYLWNIALSPVFALPGVFETNVLPNAVNGSLWSLPVEFAMYLLVAILGVVRGNRWTSLGMAVLAGLLATFWAARHREMVVVYGTDLRQLAICGVFFWSGVVCREFRMLNWFTPPRVALGFVALLALQPWPEAARVAAWVLLPVLVLSFGLASSPALVGLTRSGDYSYGIYIYAFPVQQVVAERWPALPFGVYVGVVTGVVLVCAVLSWYLVEAPALRLKPRGRRRS